GICSTTSEGSGPWSPIRDFDLTPCFEGVVVGSLVSTLSNTRVWPWMRRVKSGVCAVEALGLLVVLVVVGQLGTTERHTRFFLGVSVAAFAAASILHFVVHNLKRNGSAALLLFHLATLISASIQLRTSILTDNSLLVAVLATQLLCSLPALILEAQTKPRSPYRLLRHSTDDLEMEDLWALRHVDSANENSRLFLECWDRELRKKSPSLLMALVKAYGLAFGFAALFKASQDMLSFIQPTFLRYIMEFTNSWSPENKGHEQPISRGFGIAVLMLFAAICQTFLLHQYFHTCIVIGMRVKAAVITAIYQKALRLSPAARQSSTIGEIVNLMSVDAGRLGDLTTYFHIIWSGPFQICLALYFLYFTLGVAIFAGVAVMLLMIPVNGLLATWSRRLNKIQMSNKDKLLNGIKVIKLYAWEMPFLKLGTLIRMGYLSAGSSFTWVCTPLMVSFVSFAVYSAISDEPLTSTKVFVSMSLFNLLQFPLAMFPSVITAIIDASVSFNRLYTFLMNEELDEDAVIYEDEPVFPPAPDAPAINRVTIREGTFRWSKESPNPILQNINLVQKTPRLCPLWASLDLEIFPSLCILGEMYKSTGSVRICGKVAYVPQTPWIMNATLRENIVFGSDYDAKYYERVIAAVLPGGDMTEIGERGINLSGGQKQRINLARAVYARAMFTYDTLSAVDAHVGRHIFNQVIGPKGLLAKKTRIFVTHSIHVVHESDFVALMQGGEIVESGKYKTLMSKGAKFSALMKDYGKRKEESSSAAGSTEHCFWAGNVPMSVTETPCEPAVIAAAKMKKELSRTALTVKEESAKGSVSWKVYAAYAQSCGVGSILLFLCNAVFKLVFADWADSNDRKRDMVLRGLVSAENVEKEDVFTRLVVYGGIGLLYAASFVVQSIFVWIYCGIRSARILHNSSPSYFDTTPLGRILNRFSKDVYTVDEVLPLLAVLVINTIGNWMYALFVIPLTFGFHSRSPIYAHFQETLAGVGTIRAYSQCPRFITTNEYRVDYNMKAYYPSVSSNRWLAVRLEFIGSLIVFGSAMFAVVSIAVNGYVSASLVGLALTYSLNVTQSLNWLVRQSCEIETNIVSVERMKEYIEIPQEAPYLIPRQAPPVTWPENEGLELVLRQLSFHVNANEKIGIVGRTGAGKSSLTLALFRIMEPANGTIVLDGVDITKIGLHDLRSKLTIIPQDPFVFQGTVRENLDPFGTATDGSSNMKTVVAELDGKLEAQLLQGGENLSVGQRQLLCLARWAFLISSRLRKSRVMVLDEATAAIDYETDNIIQKTIRDLAKHSTVITIAHRINTIIDYDRILVLDHGKVAELDTPQNLLKNKRSKFFALAKEAGLVKA
ncbi:P-loop containing nucleoside triphosphate hydrolase protein, partial [Rhizoclosmatium globosum]